MGYYINETSDGTPLPPKNKALALVKDGAKVLPRTPENFTENLVCVVNNPMFEAAAYIYSERELRDFANPSDLRSKLWLVYAHAPKLSGYSE